jgi:hypothetical protein
MTSLMPKAIGGQIVPGVISPYYRFSFVTEKPYGLPQEKEVFTPSAPQKPKSLGDERHHELLGALKNIQVKQKATQIQDALPGNRDWR